MFNRSIVNTKIDNYGVSVIQKYLGEDIIGAVVGKDGLFNASLSWYDFSRFIRIPRICDHLFETKEEFITGFGKGKEQTIIFPPDYISRIGILSIRTIGRSIVYYNIIERWFFDPTDLRVQRTEVFRDKVVDKSFGKVTIADEKTIDVIIRRYWDNLTEEDKKEVFLGSSLNNLGPYDTIREIYDL